MRHALSDMRQKSLQHITVGMIPYTRYRCVRYAACCMLYAANRIPPCSDPCGIRNRMQNQMEKSANDVN